MIFIQFIALNNFTLFIYYPVTSQRSKIKKGDKLSNVSRFVPITTPMSNSFYENKKAISSLEELGHRVNVLGSDYSQSRFGQLASPVAVTKQNGIFKGGVDTFHAAYAAGL